MRLQEVHFEELLSRIGTAEPTISGSSASLIAARIGVAMARMAFAVSAKHGVANEMAIEKLERFLISLNRRCYPNQFCSDSLMLAGWRPASYDRTVIE